jgi:hypothetical protein
MATPYFPPSLTVGYKIKTRSCYERLWCARGLG